MSWEKKEKNRKGAGEKQATSERTVKGSAKTGTDHERTSQKQERSREIAWEKQASA